MTIEAQDSAGEALSVLAKMEGDEDATELAKILTKPWLESLLAAHDKIGALKTISQSNGNDDAQEALLFERLSHYSEPNIKIVRIGKPQFYSLTTYQVNRGTDNFKCHLNFSSVIEHSFLLHMFPHTYKN